MHPGGPCSASKTRGGSGANVSCRERQKLQSITLKIKISWSTVTLTAKNNLGQTVCDLLTILGPLWGRPGMWHALWGLCESPTHHGALLGAQLQNWVWLRCRQNRSNNSGEIKAIETTWHCNVPIWGQSQTLAATWLPGMIWILSREVDGESRPVMDYWKINKITGKNQFPLSSQVNHIEKVWEWQNSQTCIHNRVSTTLPSSRATNVEQLFATQTNSTITLSCHLHLRMLLRLSKNHEPWS